MNSVIARVMAKIYVASQERMTGDKLVIGNPDDYTFRQGGKFQRCQFCKEFTINGRDWGDCTVRGIAHKDAHCRRLIVRGGTG